MPIVGFRFRAYTNEQTLRALKAQLRLASEIYNPTMGRQVLPSKGWKRINPHGVEATSPRLEETR